jgi:RimJ/RimL family protein N-acetyltransferase
VPPPEGRSQPHTPDVAGAGGSEARRNLDPLFDLRVRTPRLELRLPNDDELLELYRVAEAGIHPPDEMPFLFPWTDDLSEDAFLSFHRGARESWSPDDWSCNLVTFLEGRAIGTQGMSAKRFGDERTIDTGSWLGAEFQRRGYGFEQRAAVLELAFRGLGARVATSGALEHNVASQRISEKLGYRFTGTREVAPRGEPVRHLDYRIERDDWHCPIRIEIENLERCLPLFGA